jgi:hypothetical protein
VNRRGFLAALGPGALPLAGCLSAVGSASRDNQDDATSTTTEMDQETKTTASAPPYELLDHSFRVLGAGSPREENRATVHRTADTIRITGVIRAPKDCYDARLADYESTPYASSLQVHIETHRPSDAETCEDVAVGIEYEATFEFTDRTPGHVYVTHDGESATETEAD